MNIMNNKPRNPISGKSEPSQIEILERRTDENGRTLYLVRWCLEKRESWEPIRNLKEYFKLITEFEKKYQERTINWNVKLTPAKSNSTTISSLQNKKQRVKLPENKPIPSPLIHGKINQLSDLIALCNNNEEPFTIDKPQRIESTQNSDKIDNKNQQQTNDDQNEKDPNMRVLALVKRNRKIRKTFNKVVESKHKLAKRADMINQIKINKIKEIYPRNKVWYALIETQENETKEVLRDQLRLLEPELLLKHYERLFEVKKKEFAMM